jgi:hypothetical protein
MLVLVLVLVLVLALVLVLGTVTYTYLLLLLLLYIPRMLYVCGTHVRVCVHACTYLCQGFTYRSLCILFTLLRVVRWSQLRSFSPGDTQLGLLPVLP